MILQVKLALIALILAISGGLAYTSYFKIKAAGYAEASQKYEAVLAQQQKEISEKIDRIEKHSNNLAEYAHKSDASLQKDLRQILKNSSKPLTVIKEGVCKPSDTYTNTFFLINSRTNEAIKAVQQ